MEEATAAEKKSPNAGSGDHAGPRKQTILLVEDEDPIRKLMCGVLEREGYEVLACGHPAEGIAVSKRLGRQIDLLLTDMDMPEMNGREMADRIHAILPQLPVVFISGSGEHALPQEEQVDTKFEYLQKPFTLQALKQKVAKMLGNLKAKAR
jgi:CheY-like chemotaxis protein